MQTQMCEMFIETYHFFYALELRETRLTFGSLVIVSPEPVLSPFSKEKNKRTLRRYDVLEQEIVTNYTFVWPPNSTCQELHYLKRT